MKEDVYDQLVNVDASLYSVWLKERESLELYINSQVDGIQKMYDNANTKGQIELVRRFEDRLVSLKKFYEAGDSIFKIYKNKLKELCAHIEFYQRQNIYAMEEVSDTFAEAISLTETLFEITDREEFQKKKETLIEAFKRVDKKQKNTREWLEKQK